MRRMSLSSWAMGSVCGILVEVWEIARLTVARRDGESRADFERREAEIRRQLEDHVFLLVHGAIQAVLALGLLQILPFKPRTVGLLGTIASAMNCYLLLPAYAKPAAKPKTV